MLAYYTSFTGRANGRPFLRAAFTPPRQYSGLNAAHAVMSRWDYVIGPCSLLPILPLQQLPPLHSPGLILLSLGASI